MRKVPSQISLRLDTYVQNVYEMVVSNNINWVSVLVNTAKISLYWPQNGPVYDRAHTRLDMKGGKFMKIWVDRSW